MSWQWQERNGQWVRREGELLVSVQKLDYENWGWCIEEGPGQGQSGISGSKAQAWRTARRQAINSIRRDHGLES